MKNPYRIEVDAPSGHLAITVDGDTAEAVRTTILLALVEIASVEQNAPIDEGHVDKPAVAPTTSDATVATPDEVATQDEPAFHLTRNNPDSPLQKRIQQFLLRKMPLTDTEAVNEHRLADRYNEAFADNPVSVASVKVAVRHLMMADKVTRERRGPHGYVYWLIDATPLTWKPRATLVAGEGLVAGAV